MIVIRLWCALSLATLGCAATAIAWAGTSLLMPAPTTSTIRVDNPRNGPPFVMPSTR